MPYNFVFTMTNEETIKKWEDQGFLEDLTEEQKEPIALSFEKLYMFIDDLDVHKRFNHADLQELLDLGLAMFLDIKREHLDYEFNFDDVYRTFINTKIKDLVKDNIFSKDYGENEVYLFIRYYIVPDEGAAINKKMNIDVELELLNLLTQHYKEKYVEPQYE